MNKGLSFHLTTQEDTAALQPPHFHDAKKNSHPLLLSSCSWFVHTPPEPLRLLPLEHSAPVSDHPASTSESYQDSNRLLAATVLTTFPFSQTQLLWRLISVGGGSTCGSDRR